MIGRLRSPKGSSPRTSKASPSADRRALSDRRRSTRDIASRTCSTGDSQRQGRGGIAGYKVGLTSEAIQTMYGSDQPISGVVFETGVHRSPARIALADYTHLGPRVRACGRDRKRLPARGRAVRPRRRARPRRRLHAGLRADRGSQCRPRRRGRALHPRGQLLVRRRGSGAAPHRLALARSRQHAGLAQGQRRSAGNGGHGCRHGEPAELPRLARQPARLTRDDAEAAA